MKPRWALLAVLAGCGSGATPTGGAPPVDAAVDAALDATVDAAGDVGLPIDETKDHTPIFPPPPEPDAGPDLSPACAASRPAPGDAGEAEFWFAPTPLRVPAGHLVELVICDSHGEVPGRQFLSWKFTSSDSGVFWIDQSLRFPFDGPRGFAEKPGVTVVRGEFPAENRLWYVSGTIEVTTTDIVEIQLAPPVPPLPIYGGAGLQARARYADGTTVDFTGHLRFATADRRVAVMAQASMNGIIDDSKPSVVALAPGKTMVDADFHGLKGSAPLEVTATVADAVIAPSPAEWSQLVGDNWVLVPGVDVRVGGAQFHTEELSWTPAPTGVLGLRDGRFYECATPGDGALATDLYDRRLTIPFHCVDDKKATALQIFPEEPVVMKVGESKDLLAQATFPRGLTRSVTAEWSSSDPLVAAFATPPTLAALKRGVAKVTARYGTLTATVTVAVTDP